MKTFLASMSVAQAFRDELEQAVKLELAGERVADLDQRLELPRPPRGGLVEPRVLDRDRGLRGEEGDEVLVLLRELALALLGEVEVPVRDAAEQDRHAEEGRHRRVVRREAGGVAVLLEAGEAERTRLSDQRAEDPAAVRRVADRPLRLLVDPGHEEALRAQGRSDRSRQAPRTARA